MGSYLGTCAVTKLPIEEGDQVVGFLLAKAHTAGGTDYNGYVHPGEIYQTISLAFEGTYDDYGGIDVTESALADQLMMALVGKTVAQVIEDGREEGTTIDLHGLGGVSPVRMMMVHKEIWDRLSSATTYNDKPILFEEERKAHLEMLELWDKISTSRVPAAIKGQPGMTFEFARDIDFEWDNLKGTTAPKVWRFFGVTSELSIQPVVRVPFRKMLADLWDAGDRDGAAALLDHALKVVIFDENMGALRRHWIPQPGLGWQDPCAEIHSWVAEWTANRASTLGRFFEDAPDDEGPGLAAVNKILEYGPHDGSGSDFLDAISHIKLDRHDVLGMIYIAEQALVGLPSDDPAKEVLDRVVAWKRSRPSYDKHDAIGILRICADFKSTLEPEVGMSP